MRVVSSIITDHNLWLVCLAAVVCITGSYVTVRLLERALRTDGLQRSGWLFQTASAGGSSVWCTHFIAILAYQPNTPVTFDPTLTVASLAIEIMSFALGFAIVATTRSSWAAIISGGIVGLTISLMDYVGMAAYHVSGIVAWNNAYVAASVALSVILGVSALVAATQSERPYAAAIATLAFALAILAQHYTAMAALSVIAIASTATNAAVFEAMAVAIAGVALFIIGTGVASQMIDPRARSENDRRLHHMALNDPLTGLPNRTSFSERLDRELERAEETGHELAVIGIDLNRFKEGQRFQGTQRRRPGLEDHRRPADELHPGRRIRRSDRRRRIRSLEGVSRRGRAARSSRQARGCLVRTARNRRFPYLGRRQHRGCGLSA